MSPGAMPVTPKKGADTAASLKAATGDASDGKGGYKPISKAPDLLKWVVEPTGQDLPERLHVIDLHPTPTRRNLSLKDTAKPDGPPIPMKILVLGDPATGKTSFIKRHVHDYFSERHKTTVGVDFVRKQLSVKGTTVKLQLWDIAKKDMVGPVARAFYKDAFGAILVYEAGRSSSFEALSRWKNDIDEMVRLPDGSRLPVVVVATKCDLVAVLHREALNSFCLRNGFIGWFETSAKLNYMIDEASHFLVESILDIMPPAGTSASWFGAKAERGCGDYFCFSWCM